MAQSLGQFASSNVYPGYNFKFNIQDKGYHTREEESSIEGHVTGKYSYMDPNGNLRVIRYNSTPENGFVAYGDTGAVLLKGHEIEGSINKASLTTTNEKPHRNENTMKEQGLNVPLYPLSSGAEKSYSVPSTKMLYFPESNNLISPIPPKRLNRQVFKKEFFNAESKPFNVYDDVDKLLHGHSKVIPSKTDDIKPYNTSPFSKANAENQAAVKTEKKPEIIAPLEDASFLSSGKERNALDTSSNKINYFSESNILSSRLPENKKFSKIQSSGSETKFFNMYYFDDGDKMTKNNKMSVNIKPLRIKQNEVLKNDTESNKKIQDFFKSSSKYAKQQHTLALPLNFFPYFIYPTPHLIAVHPTPFLL